jgi:myo-inositol-1(or 4)-monophosphatase
MNMNRALSAAKEAAGATGEIMRRELNASKKANSSTQHDIKLELDVRCQKLIEKSLHSHFPEIGVLGEEGSVGDPASEYRWVVDPIDGTVNFAYSIPHACVSIALQKQIGEPSSLARRRQAKRTQKTRNTVGAGFEDNYQTLAGVVYDPFQNEMWTATLGQPARLNGRIISVSNRRHLKEAIVSIGFAKSRENLERTLPYFNELVHRIRKVRLMGAAALALAYVATGRFDAYIERGIRLWDIAAGGLLVECAGGEFWREAIPGKAHTYRMIAANNHLRRNLRVPG